MVNTTVSLYTRDERGYRKTDPRGIYPADRTTFVLRYVGDDMKRVWETLPKNTNFAGARKLCLEKELWLGDPAAQTPSIKREPAKAAVPAGDGRIRIADAIGKYIDHTAPPTTKWWLPHPWSVPLLLQVRVRPKSEIVKEVTWLPMPMVVINPSDSKAAPSCVRS